MERLSYQSDNTRAVISVGVVRGDVKSRLDEKEYVEHAVEKLPGSCAKVD